MFSLLAVEQKKKLQQLRKKQLRKCSFYSVVIPIVNKYELVMSFFFLRHKLFDSLSIPIIYINIFA